MTAGEKEIKTQQKDENTDEKIFYKPLDVFRVNHVFVHGLHSAALLRLLLCSARPDGYHMYRGRHG